MYANRAKLKPSELILRLDELELVLASPGAEGHLEKAEALAMYIARNAASGPIANRAMQLMSAAIQLRGADRPDAGDSLQQALSQLRAAFENIERSDLS